MRLTIITPTYNRADLLPKTIESVLRQDYQTIEYIALDDGSKDDTPRVLQRYTGKVRAEHHPNIGETLTVNKGFELATDELVRLRDWLEADVHAKLGIPYNTGAPTVRYEHSMGQGMIPSSILRTTPTATMPGGDP